MNHQDMIDLDAYFKRIHWRPEHKNSLEALKDLVLNHTLAIPFENLDSLSGLTVPLDIPALGNKLLHARRGGYCFEHNMLLWNVLSQLGFKVTGLAGRVRWNVPDEVITPIGHMALRIDLDDRAYLVDAGFGGITLTAPLRLDTTETQFTSHEPFRIVHEGDERTLQVKLGEHWRSMYVFKLSEYLPVDYQVWNWFTCTAPVSPFISHLMLARPDAKGRHALRGNVYTWHELNGASHTHSLPDTGALRDCIQQRFDIDVPAHPLLEERLVTQINRHPR